MEQLDLLSGLKKSDLMDIEDAHDYLKAICKSEPLIFLYGENPHICAIRSHANQEDNQERWVERKKALAILTEAEYVYHSDYVKGEARAKVYKRN